MRSLIKRGIVAVLFRIPFHWAVPIAKGICRVWPGFPSA